MPVPSRAGQRQSVENAGQSRLAADGGECAEGRCKAASAISMG